MKGATTDYNSTHPIRVPLACISQIETAGSGEFFPMHTKIPCAVINEQPLEGWEYQRIGKPKSGRKDDLSEIWDVIKGTFKWRTGF
ncbi:hypothetical protein JTE90_010814 [Oedothorax gibbosus]|uniref:Uncharacterized protein n=1 Tax=Oedothorax gibbosus TaxID=931172 RepID=A0AAV6V2R0_9ARAC|nr:hypothetical protein JTE90_010814 [Oedothorax gibbosus]